MQDLISRQDVINAVLGSNFSACTVYGRSEEGMATAKELIQAIKDLPSAQPERLTDDDFETIRIHLNAYKETLCNQRRWKEAEEYQRIINRFLSFAQPERKKGKWIKRGSWYCCSECGTEMFFTGVYDENQHYCYNCGSYNGGGEK